MTPIVQNWANRHGVSQEALNELYQLLVPASAPATNKKGSEAYVDSLLMLEASKKDVTLFRNNVGACQDKTGRLIRYGLANESKQMNERIKSSDRIGWRKVLITQDMVGSHIGQFVARETKHAGWTGRTLDSHEQAQADFMMMALLAGCDAAFASGAGTL